MFSSGSALVAASAVLIRSAGVAAVAAIFLYFVSKRLWKQAAMFTAVVAVCVLPWLTYSRIYAPTAEQQQQHRGAILYSYGQQFWMRWAGSATTGRATPADLGERVSTNIVDVFGRGMGGIFAPALLRGSEESGEELLSIGGTVGWTFVGIGNLPVNMAVSVVLSVIVVAGFLRTIRRGLSPAEFLVPISLAIAILWPWWTFRFIVPLTPFLFVYLIEGASAIDLRVARVVVMTIAGLHLYDHAGYVMHLRSKPNGIGWIARFNEVEETMQWMSTHLEKDAVVATTNPPLVYLHTGHRTITLDTLTENWSAWRARGARYVAPLIPRALPSASKGDYKIVYENLPHAENRMWVIDID